jgi:hypothetical protein
MRYQDFEIKIAAGPRGKYTSSAVSDFGPGESPFKLPFPKDQMHEVPEQFDRLLNPKSSPPSQFTSEQIGKALFGSLFAGTVETRFRESSASLAGRIREEGLRIRLNFDLDDPRLAPLAALPWELIYNLETKEFLSRLRHISVVRFLPVARESTTWAWDEAAPEPLTARASIRLSQRTVASSNLYATLLLSRPRPGNESC